MAVQWSTIKKAYVSGKGSYRELARKYGVSLTQIAQHAKKEDWVAARAAAKEATETRAIQKTVEKTAETVSDTAAAEARIKLKLALLVEKWVDSKTEIDDAGEFRKIVQSCVDLGMVETKAIDNENSGGGVVMMPSMDTSLLDD